MNLSSNAKIVRHSNAVAAGATVITPSGDIDMKGFDACLLIAEFGAITATAVTSVEVHQSSDAGVADSYTAIAGTKVTVADSDDDKVVYVDVIRPRERYLKMIVNRATANAVLEGITAILYSPGEAPVTQDATVIGGEIHHAAAEGTA